jgi:hypothetical protein
VEIKHTPTPWIADLEAGAIFRIEGNEEIQVADISAKDEDLEFIVRACNAHEDVLVALRSARDELVSLNNNHLSGAAAVVRALVTKQIERYNAAIAKAECKL